MDLDGISRWELLYSRSVCKKVARRPASMLDNQAKSDQQVSLECYPSCRNGSPDSGYYRISARNGAERGTSETVVFEYNHT
jgi:hypothetical protein